MMSEHYLLEGIMKKSVLAGMLLTSTFLMGAEYDMFIGLEGVSERVELDSGDTSDFEYGFGGRAGFTADDHRIYLVYDYNDFEEGGDDTDLHTVFVALEGVTQPYELAPWLSTSFFGGAHFGVHRFETDDSDDETRTMYGFQGGMMLSLAPQFNAEVGYRYSLSTVDVIDKVEGPYVALNIVF
jgi:hypothetical protein